MATQVATEPFRKVGAVELYGTNAALGVSGNPVIAGPAAPSAMVRGQQSTTGTGAITLIAAQGSGVKIYVTQIQVYREDAGTSGIHITLNDSASTVIGVPNSGGGGGNNPAYFSVPLVVAANTALTFTASSGVTTLYVSAQGYTGA